MRSPRRPLLRAAVRATATAALAAAVALPLARRRLKLSPAATTAAVAAGPLALTVLRPRTRSRDIGMFALQMWAFTIVHELPYDDPVALRRRLKVRYPIRFDRALGGGRLPSARLQAALSSPGRATGLDRALSAIHWAWFIEPYAALLYVLVRDEAAFPRAARQMAATYDLGCAVYVALPTAPPWWAAENGYTGDERVHRLMEDVGREVWGPIWPRLYASLGGNPWAAMPSLHFGSSVMAAMLLSESSRLAGALAWAYALSLGFALVYLGEHYVADLAAGGALATLVHFGEPLVEPLALAASGGLQALERVANA